MYVIRELCSNIRVPGCHECQCACVHELGIGTRIVRACELGIGTRIVRACIHVAECFVLSGVCYVD